MRTVILSADAARDLDGLPREARTAIESALYRYAVTGYGDVKALTGRDGFRLRVGAYRVIFAQGQTTILAIYVGRRVTTTYRRN